MKEITAYKTNDGEIFDDPEVALDHERAEEFDTWYAASGVKGVVLAGADEVREWLTDNSAEVLKFLGAEKLRPVKLTKKYQPN